MPRFVALLRGVNVGKGNRVPMAEFARLLEELGCTEVTTVLNSGNAVFSSTARSTSRLAERIALALRENLGVTTPVVVKTAAEMATILDECPFTPPETEHSRLLVAFAMDATALEALAPLADLAEAPERFIVTEQAAYLYSPKGLLASRVGEALLGKAGRAVTTRNLATTRRLVTLLDSP